MQENDEMGASSSCSSPENRSFDGDEYSYNLEITDESELDGEVGKRLNEIIPVPVSVKVYFFNRTFIYSSNGVYYLMQHVPKVNGDIPSVDEATSDHQRLLDRFYIFFLVLFVNVLNFIQYHFY